MGVWSHGLGLDIDKPACRRRKCDICGTNPPLPHLLVLLCALHVILLPAPLHGCCRWDNPILQLGKFSLERLTCPRSHS